MYPIFGGIITPNGLTLSIYGKGMFNWILLFAKLLLLLLFPFGLAYIGLPWLFPLTGQLHWYYFGASGLCEVLTGGDGITWPKLPTLLHLSR